MSFLLNASIISFMLSKPVKNHFYSALNASPNARKYLSTERSEEI